MKDLGGILYFTRINTKPNVIARTIALMLAMIVIAVPLNIS